MDAFAWCIRYNEYDGLIWFLRDDHHKTKQAGYLWEFVQRWIMTFGLPNHTNHLAEGVLVAPKNYNLPAHPELTAVPNLQVIKAMQSLTSRGLVKTQFSWQWYYYTLTPEGVEYLREYLNLPSEIVPQTHKKAVRPPRPAGVRAGGDGAYRAPRGDGERGGRDDYRKKEQAGGDYRPSFAGVGRGGPRDWCYLYIKTAPFRDLRLGLLCGSTSFDSCIWQSESLISPFTNLQTRFHLVSPVQRDGCELGLMILIHSEAKPRCLTHCLHGELTPRCLYFDTKTHFPPEQFWTVKAQLSLFSQSLSAVHLKRFGWYRLDSSSSNAWNLTDS